MSAVSPSEGRASPDSARTPPSLPPTSGRDGHGPSILSLDLSEPVLRSLFRNGVRWVSQVDGMTDEKLELASGVLPWMVGDLRQQLRNALKRSRPIDDEPLTASTMHVPSAERPTSIKDLGLSTRAFNILRKYGCRTLGDLHGLTGAALMSMRGMGRSSLSEIIDALARRTSVAGVPALAKDLPPAPAPVPTPVPAPRQKALMSIDLTGVSFPGLARAWRADPGTDLRRSRVLFRQLNVVTVDLLLQRAADGATIADTESNRAAVQNLRRVSAWLATALAAGTFRSTNGELRLPRRALVLNQAAAAKARTVSEELAAMFLRVAEQNVLTVTRRWSCTAGRFPTLDEVGAQREITRERARQIVARAEQDLVQSHTWLPRTARLLQDFARERSTWTVAQLRKAFAARGELVSEDEIRLLPTFGRLGAIPECTIDHDDLMHLPTHADADTYSGAGAGNGNGAGNARAETEALEAKVAATVLKLKRNGWLKAATGGGSGSWDPDSAMAALLARRLRPRVKEFRVVDGAVLPNPGTPSSLTRWVTRRLHVAGATPVDALYERMTIFVRSGYGQRLKLRLPSLYAFATMLSLDPRFEVADGVVSLDATRLKGDPLTPGERVLVEAVRSAGGSVDYRTIVALGERGGLSVSAVTLFLQGPLVDRVRTAHYRLP